MQANSHAPEATARIDIQTPGVHHVALRVSDYERAKKFYTEILGFDIVLEKPNFLIFFAGQTAIAIRGPEPGTAQHGGFNPFRVGLDHLALACADEQELQRIADSLERAGVENTGVKMDETLGKKYVAFKDPDRIAWEYYMV